MLPMQIRKVFKKLQEELRTTLENTDIQGQNLILAALARIIAERLDENLTVAAKPKPKKRK